MIKIICTLLTLAGFVFEADAGGDPLDWPHPILRQRADPHGTWHTDGWYYFTATVPEYDRIELRRARTPGELPAAEMAVIWRRHDRGPMSHQPVWPRPQLLYHHPRWQNGYPGLPRPQL